MRAELDCGAMRTCGAFHAGIAAALGFPAYYGANLDALYDCLTDLPAGTELCLRGFSSLEERLGPVYARKLRRVLDDAAAEGRFRWISE